MVVRVSTGDPHFELALVNDFCHDALFERENVIYDAGGKRLTIRIGREIPGQPTRWKRFLPSWTSVLVPARLVFHGVVLVQLDIADVEDSIASVDFRAEDNTVVLTCVRGSRITLQVERFDVELLDEVAAEAAPA